MNFKFDYHVVMMSILFLVSFSFLFFFLFFVREKFNIEHLPNRSLPILRRTAVHGRSVFSKQRHHSLGVIVLSWSKSQVSRNGLIQRSFWSCSKSYISWVDKKPSLFKSKWPNIHLASFLQAAGKRAEGKRKMHIKNLFDIGLFKGVTNIILTAENPNDNFIMLSKLSVGKPA